MSGGEYNTASGLSAFVGGGDQTVSWTPGSGSWSFVSDRAAKDRFVAVDARTVLDKVAQLPVMEWSYRGYGQRHIGAMAQDFHALFPLNGNDKVLNDADLHGVELAAIQGLNQKLEAGSVKLETENARLHLKAPRAPLPAALQDASRLPVPHSAFCVLHFRFRFHFASCG